MIEHMFDRARQIAARSGLSGRPAGRSAGAFTLWIPLLMARGSPAWMHR
jgi:hypothetical protein